MAATLRPLAVARLLDAIDAQDVLRWSHGYRPPVGALDAGKTLTITRPCGRDAWVVEADITKCLDTLDHDWMVRRFAERIDDGARLRRIQTGRQAGGLDTDGQGLHPGTGTPQGGTVSPRLAKVCLHYGRDVWVEKVVKQPGRGEASLLRDADDFGCACADHAEAERFDTVLGQRLETCGLARSGATTRILSCRRHRRAGTTSVAFLGCAVRWGKDRKGHAHLTRRTARQKRRNALKRFTAWCKENRHLRLPVLFQRLNATLRGYDHASGVHGNAASLQQCFTSAMRMLLKWRNRRSPRHSDTWQGYQEGLKRFKVARPRIVGRPKTR